MLEAMGVIRYPLCFSKYMSSCFFQIIPPKNRPIPTISNHTVGVNRPGSGIPESVDGIVVLPLLDAVGVADGVLVNDGNPPIDPAATISNILLKL